MGQKRLAIYQALEGLHYGPTCMVFCIRFQNWYCAHVVSVDGDLIKVGKSALIQHNPRGKCVKIYVQVKYRGWESDEEDLHKLSDRLDCHTGGRKKWKGVKGAAGAFHRVWPNWTPTGALVSLPVVQMSFMFPCPSAHAVASCDLTVVSGLLRYYRGPALPTLGRVKAMGRLQPYNARSRQPKANQLRSLAYPSLALRICT